MRETGEIRVRLSGDTEAAQRYLGQARVFLGMLKQSMQASKLLQGVRRFVLPDGSEIVVQSIFGQDIVSITAASVVIAQEVQIEEGHLGDEVSAVIVVGYNKDDDGETYPFMWDRASGTVQIPGVQTGAATGISKDGTTVVGHVGSVPSSDKKAFVWTKAGGVVMIPGSGKNSVATGVSGDGRIVVGYEGDAFAGEGFAWCWTAKGGLVRLPDFGVGNGNLAVAISSNGKYVTGTAGVRRDFTTAVRIDQNLVSLGTIVATIPTGVIWELSEGGGGITGSVSTVPQPGTSTSMWVITSAGGTDTPVIVSNPDDSIPKDVSNAGVVVGETSHTELYSQEGVFVGTGYTGPSKVNTAFRWDYKSGEYTTPASGTAEAIAGDTGAIVGDERKYTFETVMVEWSIGNFAPAHYYKLATTDSWFLGKSGNIRPLAVDVFAVGITDGSEAIAGHQSKGVPVLWDSRFRMEFLPLLPGMVQGKSAAVAVPKRKFEGTRPG